MSYSVTITGGFSSLFDLIHYFEQTGKTDEYVIRPRFYFKSDEVEFKKLGWEVFDVPGNYNLLHFKKIR